MRLTFQKYRKSASIYIYLREFDGIIVNTLTGILGDLLYDADNHWIGVAIYNTNPEKEIIQLPKMKQPYIAKENESFFQDEEKIVIIFDSDRKVFMRNTIYCNLDFNNPNGLQGVEILVEDFEGKLDIANRFIK
jgi:hypothetical protein